MAVVIDRAGAWLFAAACFVLHRLFAIEDVDVASRPPRGSRERVGVTLEQLRAAELLAEYVRRRDSQYACPDLRTHAERAAGDRLAGIAGVRRVDAFLLLHRRHARQFREQCAARRADARVRAAGRNVVPFPARRIAR